MNDKILKKMIKLVNKTENSDDIPVACIIVKDNNIISSDYNKKYKNNDPLAHAEILAIKKACKKLNRTNLSDCELFTTLCPCKMCEAAINEVRIKKVNYILNQNKTTNNTITYKQVFVNKKEYFNKKIKEFFSNKR